MDEVVIKVDHISKNFVLPHEKVTSVKGAFTSALRHRNKSRDVQHALKNINFEIKKGEFFGIVGRNGSGKSTMLKILAGIYRPTKGAIHTTGKLVPFIELGVGFNPELTGRENVFLNGALLGFSRKEISAMYDEIVAFAELERFMDKKLKNYSSGMQVRLAFSMATRAEADILLVDEVLAVGDADFQKKCFRYFKDLKRQQKTVVFVSHDMNAVKEYCDRAVLIEKSEIVFEGDSFDVANAYTRMFLDRKHKSGPEGATERWGSGEVRYGTIKVRPEKVGKNDEVITLSTEAVVQKDIPNAVLGFKVRAEDNTALIGSNTRLRGHELKDLHAGDHITLTWTFPNIFNTGVYRIDLAIQSDDYEVMYDSWEEAMNFVVDRQEDSSYPVQPRMNLSVKVGR
ncbi:MAG: ABC transporter ATP-binding protein [Candidatus Saccharibacteria bacterium]